MGQGSSLRKSIIGSGHWDDPWSILIDKDGQSNLHIASGAAMPIVMFRICKNFLVTDLCHSFSRWASFLSVG